MTGITRCLLADSWLPKLVWGKRPDTVFSAHHGDPEHKALRGKEVILKHIMNLGSRAFVHIETNTKALEDRSWGGQALREPSGHQGVPHLQRNSTSRRRRAGPSSLSRWRRMWFYRRSTRPRASTRWATSTSFVFTTDQEIMSYCETYDTAHRA